MACKYHKGKQITSLDELAEQEFIFCRDKVLHQGWFKSWQYRMAIDYIKRGWLYTAEDKERYVEVVRCKDCKYRVLARVNSNGFLVCPASGMEITDTDYCSYGEKG